MTRLTYKRALDEALTPLGFVREKSDWVRLRGEIEDCVNLQKSWLDGSVTVNLYAKNVETDRMLRAIDPTEPLGFMPIYQRIGHLIDNLDHWWKNNPDGPTELSSAVVTYGIPWFERVWTLEGELSVWFGPSRIGSWTRPNLSALAMTLYRLGRIDEALALFDEPVPRMFRPNVLHNGRIVQRWLQDQVAGPQDARSEARPRGHPPADNVSPLIEAERNGAAGQD